MEFNNLEFSHLKVSAEFYLGADPLLSISDELVQRYKVMIFASPENHPSHHVPIGSMMVDLYRFDAAFNLGRSLEWIAEKSGLGAKEVYRAMKQEFADINAGMHLSCLVISCFEVEKELRRADICLQAIRVALIGLGNGASRAFLPLGIHNDSSLNLDMADINEVTLWYSRIGFKPLRLGHELLWLDMDAQEFWG